MKEKVEAAINEARTLVLIVHILVGFDLRAPFEQRFSSLPQTSQQLKLVALALQLAALALLLLPAAYHRIVARSEDTYEFRELVTWAIGLALAPFALGVGIEMYVVVSAGAGQTTGIVAGATGALLSLGLWYGFSLIGAKRENGPSEEEREEMAKGTDVDTKVKNVLTEIRVVLPGVQALIGFQMAGVLTDAFDKLPAFSKGVHLGGLGLLTLAAVLLMTPPAYHRIHERGENTDRFERLASRYMLVAMVPLALGIAGDAYVVFAKVLESTTAGWVAGMVVALGFLGLWFGYTWMKRAAGGEQPAQVGRPDRGVTARAA